MDKGKLRQHESVKREVEDLKEKIRQTEERLAEMESRCIAADVVSGGEGGMRHFKVEGFPYPEYERQKSRLYMRKLRLEKLAKELGDLADEVDGFIAGVEDSRMRRILRLRYQDGMSWKEVAGHMGKGGSADAIRMEHDRFLKKLR